MNIKERIIISLILIISGIILAEISTTIKALEQKNIKVHVLQIYDGDTYVVKLPEMPEYFKHLKWKVRLNGIDTPEISHRAKCKEELEKGLEAKHLAEKIILDNGGYIELRNIKHGKYAGRIIADVYVGDVNLSQLLITKKLGYVYNGGKRENIWCEENK